MEQELGKIETAKIAVPADAQEEKTAPTAQRKSITFPDPPQSWMELSKEQLIYIHSLPRSEMAESIFKLHVFLNLCGLELCQESYYEEPDIQVNEIKDDEDVDKINKSIDWMESVLNGTAQITVVLRRTHKGDEKAKEEDEERFCINDKDLFEAISHFTKFLDDPYKGFPVQPLGDIVIGKHTYRTPGPIFSNLTYEQYTNAQSALMAYWNVGQTIDELQQQLMKAEASHNKRQQKLVKMSGGTHKVREFVPDPNMLKQIEESTKEFADCQAEFLSHVMTVLHPKVIEEAEIDEEGNIKKDKKGKPIIKQVATLEPVTISVDADAARMLEEIKSNVPPYVFPILYQHFQSSMLEHKEKFPKLFEGKKAAGETSSDPMVSQIATINTLMKEQGYMSQQDVFDANAVFNFQKLDELTRKAEEMEKLNNEMKRKSKSRH